MLAGYNDVQLIGQGGLGKVYRARRLSTGGLVAIKELRDVEEASPAWHRAQRELDAMLRLKGHPYVISVEEVAQGPDGPCLVMEYAPNGSLLDRVQANPLTGAEVILVGQQVCEALSAAHAVGIVHRDIKPQNLLIGSFGQVKVCDFGISQLARDGAANTKTGAITMAYASPEEIDGVAQVGPAADVYSFGATMVHLITGVRPTFQNRVNTGSIDLTAADPALAPVLGLLRQSLAHAPEDRPTITDLATGFDNAAAQLNTGRARFLLVPAAPPTQVWAAPPAAGAVDVGEFVAATVPRAVITPLITAVPGFIEPPASIAQPIPAPTSVVAPAPVTDPDLELTIPRPSFEPRVIELQPRPGAGKPTEKSRRKFLVAASLVAFLGLGGAAFAMQGGGGDGGGDGLAAAGGSGVDGGVGVPVTETTIQEETTVSGTAPDDSTTVVGGGGGSTTSEPLPAVPAAPMPTPKATTPQTAAKTTAKATTTAVQATPVVTTAKPTATTVKATTTTAKATATTVKATTTTSKATTTTAKATTTTSKATTTTVKATTTTVKATTTTVKATTTTVKATTTTLKPTTTTVPAKTVTISLSGPTAISGCTFTRCYWIVGSMSGFGGVPTQVQCSTPTQPNAATFTATTSWGTGKCWLGTSTGGQQGWVTAGGIKSNTVVAA